MIKKTLDWDSPVGPYSKPTIPMPTEMLPVTEDTTPACPYNLNHDEMEKALLVSALCQPDSVIPYCKRIGLHSGAFQDPTRRKIYKTIINQFNSDKRIDPILISEASEIPTKVFDDLLSLDSNPTHGAQYADIVREQWTKRKLGELVLAIQDASNNGQNVFKSITDLQNRLNDIRPVDTTISIQSLTYFANLPVDPAKTLLGNRFLCREGGMLFIGPSGVGKSSASVQQDILWSLGRPAFGIKPAQPLRIATIQAENDDGDLTEMARGIMNGLELTPEQRETVQQNTFYISEKSKTGPRFIQFVESVLSITRPDILRLDPLQSYVGGDTSDVEIMSDFVHSGLNPLLQKYQCAVIVNHHTPKTNNRDTSKYKSSDWQYAGAGSAILTNWARAVIVVDPCKDNAALFRFIASKRAFRTEWVNENDERTYIKYFKHAREDGVIFWLQATEDEAKSAVNAPKTKYDLMDIMPTAGAIPKDDLISQAKLVGIGKNKAWQFINLLVADKEIYIWKIPRPGMSPRVDLSRTPQSEQTLV
jgi:hypothetical protein